jgi:hypothetical protein
LRFKSRSKLIVLRVFRADPTFISAVSGDVFMRAPAMEKRLLSLHQEVSPSMRSKLEQAFEDPLNVELLGGGHVEPAAARPRARGRDAAIIFDSEAKGDQDWLFAERPRTTMTSVSCCNIIKTVDEH